MIVNGKRKRKACDPVTGPIHKESKRKRMADFRAAALMALRTAVLLGNPAHALCLMESEGKMTSGRLFHATPYKYVMQPHPTKAALRGIFHTGSIAWHHI